MSEINCLVIFNNLSQFELNMDSQVTFGMVNDQIRKNFQLPDNVPLQFSYLDNEDDSIRISSEVEFKEFLDYASTVEFITLLVNSTSNTEIPPIELPEAIPVPLPAIVEENVPQEESKEEEVKEQPNFNIKYQIPLIRRHKRMNVPINHIPMNNAPVRPHIARTFRVICDNCQEQIENLRYKCLQCPDYDLCEKCEELKCKSESNQIHPDDHIFAKIRSPIHRPVPNFPHPRHIHHRFSGPRGCPRIHSTLLNNNNNNNNNNVQQEVNNTSENHNQHHERRKEWAQKFQQRGERIKELEDRVQVLEKEISQILSTLRSPVNNNNNNNDQRKYWAFQC